MKFSFSTKGWHDSTFEEFCDIAQDLGFQGIELHNIHKNEADRQRLIEVGGYEQVPCLFIDGKPLYESLDIIDWLKAHPQA